MIRLESLTKNYGKFVAVDGIDLHVPRGELFGFLGPNGAGKTTTIRVLLGLLKPSEGSSHIFGMDCWRGGHRARVDVGYLSGDLRLYPWLNCRNALHIFGRIRGMDLTSAGSELADYFELDQNVRVAKMSRGMRQKLGLIVALAHRPGSLLFGRLGRRDVY